VAATLLLARAEAAAEVAASMVAVSPVSLFQEAAAAQAVVVDRDQQDQKDHLAATKPIVTPKP
jgi:hypothetical protein